MSKALRLLALAATGIAFSGPSCHPIGPPEGMAARHTETHPSVPPPANPTQAVVPTPATQSPPTASAPTPAAPTANTAGTAANPPTSPKPAAASSTPPKPAAPAVKDEIPTAQKAPGRPGYVLSPYTGKLMLVRGVPSGVVVPDQTSPDSGKKFRVP